jgi:hypothetical protein
MNDADLVRRRQRRCQLSHDGNRAHRIHPPLADDAIERRAGHVLLHQEIRAILELAEIGRGSDVRVVHVRPRYGFAPEAGDELG